MGEIFKFSRSNSFNSQEFSEIGIIQGCFGVVKNKARKVHVARPQGELYEVIEVNSNNTYDLAKYSAYTYEYSPGGLSGGSNFGADLWLPAGQGTNYGARLDSVVSILPGKKNKLVQGDMVEVCFYDRSRQRPYIKRLLKRGIYQFDEGQPGEPITSYWYQTEAAPWLPGGPILSGHWLNHSSSTEFPIGEINNIYDMDPIFKRSRLFQGQVLFNDNGIVKAVLGGVYTDEGILTNLRIFEHSGVSLNEIWESGSTLFTYSTAKEDSNLEYIDVNSWSNIRYFGQNKGYFYWDPSMNLYIVVGPDGLYAVQRSNILGMSSVLYTDLFETVDLEERPAPWLGWAFGYNLGGTIAGAVSRTYGITCNWRTTHYNNDTFSMGPDPKIFGIGLSLSSEGALTWEPLWEQNLKVLFSADYFVGCVIGCGQCGDEDFQNINGTQYSTYTENNRFPYYNPYNYNTVAEDVKKWIISGSITENNINEDPDGEFTLENLTGRVSLIVCSLNPDTGSIINQYLIEPEEEPLITASMSKESRITEIMAAQAVVDATTIASYQTDSIRCTSGFPAGNGIVDYAITGTYYAAWGTFEECAEVLGSDPILLSDHLTFLGSLIGSTSTVTSGTVSITGTIMDFFASGGSVSYPRDVPDPVPGSGFTGGCLVTSNAYAIYATINGTLETNAIVTYPTYVMNGSEYKYKPGIVLAAPHISHRAIGLTDNRLQTPCIQMDTEGNSYIIAFIPRHVVSSYSGRTESTSIRPEAVASLAWEEHCSWLGGSEWQYVGVCGDGTDTSFENEIAVSNGPSFISYQPEPTNCEAFLGHNLGGYPVVAGDVYIDSICNQTYTTFLYKLDKNLGLVWKKDISLNYFQWWDTEFQDPSIKTPHWRNVWDLKIKGKALFILRDMIPSMLRVGHADDILSWGTLDNRYTHPGIEVWDIDTQTLKHTILMEYPDRGEGANERDFYNYWAVAPKLIAGITTSGLPWCYAVAVQQDGGDPTLGNDTINRITLVKMSDAELDTKEVAHYSTTGVYESSVVNCWNLDTVIIENNDWYVIKDSNTVVRRVNS